MEGKMRVFRMSCVLLLAAAALGFSGAAYAAGEGWLGVMLQPLSDELIAAMSLDKGTTGVLVSDVVDDSPADEAGFEKGDIIVEIDGASITDVDGAIAKVKGLDAGSKVKMVVVRDGKKQVLTTVLGDRAQMPAKLEAEDDEGDDADGEAEEEYYNFRIPRIERIFKDIKDIKDIRIGHGGYLGVEIRDVSADLGHYFGVAAGEGLLVLEVAEDSPAEDAGLRAGDVIIKVDGQDVGCSGEFASYVRDHEPGEKLDITFKRSKETRRVAVELGESPDAARIFLNQAGVPDGFTWMGDGPKGCKQRCIQIGDKCLMMGKQCKHMGKECARDCKMKTMECGKKAMECHEKAMEEHGMMKCRQMMEEPPPMPGKCMESPGQEKMKVMMMQGGGDDLRMEMEQLKQEIENLKGELEALRTQ